MDDKTKTIVDAATAISDLDNTIWYDLADHLTCSEADAFVALLAAVGNKDAAGILREVHRLGDEPGDRHWAPCDEQVEFEQDHGSGWKLIDSVDQGPGARPENRYAATFESREGHRAVYFYTNGAWACGMN